MVKSLLDRIFLSVTAQANVVLAKSASEVGRRGLELFGRAGVAGDRSFTC